MTGQKELELVRFADRDLITVKESENVYVALKPICEALEIDWQAQHKAVMKDEVLKSVVSQMETTGADGQTYQMVCLPLDYLNGWLFRINAAHFAEGKRALIVRYQRECYRVLAEHFQGGRAEAAVASAVMERIRAAELADRRNILKQLGGIMSGYGLSAAAVSRLAREAENVVRSDWWHPGLPSESWAEAGSEGEPELLRRSSSMLNA